ncbi:MAG TPA: hypothetical protein VFX86_04735 [Candidatus Saccharimonadales bacterium]|nr:hypothetical protein [Candidatus Saccharimonadales bacterium]
MENWVEFGWLVKPPREYDTGGIKDWFKGRYVVENTVEVEPVESDAEE